MRALLRPSRPRKPQSYGSRPVTCERWGACIGGTTEPPSCSEPPIEAASEHDGGKGGIVAQYEAYCVKCKAKRQFEGTVVTLKNGRNAASGTCPVCGTKVMRILGKADVAAS